MNRETKYRAFIGNQMLPVRAMNFFADGTVHVQCGDDWFLIAEQWGNYLMKWTGMRDAKGTEIFEADILKHDDGNWGYGGEYDKTHDGYLYSVVPDIADILKGDFGWDEWWSFEVIGNIHEHPDLCGKQEEQL